MHSWNEPPPVASTQPAPHRLRGRRSAYRRQGGAAIVELAFVLPLLLLLFLGAMDFGRVMYWSITLTHAARAGAQYGVQSTAIADKSTAIRAAALAEAQDIGAIGVNSRRYCLCPPQTSVVCTSTCSGYGPPRVFVEVTTDATFRTLVPWPGIPATVPMVRTASMRLQ
jgi:Flp pilus assembly protein TadG